jgi:TolB-like protein
LFIGFPIAVFLAWVYELTPEGVKREKDVDPARSITDVTGRKLDFVIIGVLIVAVVMFALDKFVWSDEPLEAGAPRSIAVLPFLNMTPDKEQEYFSDGLTEELLNLLVKIPELRVASRTSSFFYKDKDVRIADVGRDLAVGHVLEGSVRRAGDKVRITAQLIDVPTDTHIWSDVWERTLDDVFAIQDEIAMAVVEALRVRLTDDVPHVTPTSPEAYSLYLEAGQKIRHGESSSLQEAEDMLRQALEIDEAYVPAWLRLADAYTNPSAVGDYNRDQQYALARAATIEALRADPDSVEAVHKLSSIGMSYAAEAERDLYTRGFDPVHDSGNVLEPAHFERSIGFLAEATGSDAENAALSFVLGQHKWLARKYPQSVEALERAVASDASLEGANYYLALALLGSGEPEAAMEQVDMEVAEGYRLAGRAIVLHALGQESRSDSELEALLETGYRWPYQVAQVHAWRNEADAAFEWLGHAHARRDAALNLLGGDPLMDNIRSDERFDQFWADSRAGIQ